MAVLSICPVPGATSPGTYRLRLSGGVRRGRSRSRQRSRYKTDGAVGIPRQSVQLVGGIPFPRFCGTGFATETIDERLDGNRGHRAGADGRRIGGGRHGRRGHVHQELRAVQEDVGRLLRGTVVRGRMRKVQGQDDPGLREHRLGVTVPEQAGIVFEIARHRKRTDEQSIIP
uniref:Uncharacterized protein n=1 Tax=Sipha flava TaxID=143950 RepID=A0A2S2QXZ4_9HEMI